MPESLPNVSDVAAQSTEFSELGSVSLNAGESFSMYMDVSFHEFRAQHYMVNGTPRRGVLWFESPSTLEKARVLFYFNSVLKALFAASLAH